MPENIEFGSHFGSIFGAKMDPKSFKNRYQNGCKIGMHFGIDFLSIFIDLGGKWTPKWRPRAGHFLVIWLFFSVPGGLGSPNGSQGLSQQPPGSVQASISTDFWSILDDFLMIFCIMWATFYLACLITFLFTLSLHFQISGHKFKCVGVVRRGQ